MGEMAAEFEMQGIVWFRNALTSAALRPFEDASDLGRRPGARVDGAAIHEDAIGPASPLRRLAKTILPGARAVRVVAFHKTPGSTWSFPWPPDPITTVAARWAGGRAPCPGPQTLPIAATGRAGWSLLKRCPER